MIYRGLKTKEIFSVAVGLFVLVCNSSLAQEQTQAETLLSNLRNVFSDEGFRLGNTAEAIYETLMRNGFSQQRQDNYQLLAHPSMVSISVNYFQSPLDAPPRTASPEEINAFMQEQRDQRVVKRIFMRTSLVDISSLELAPIFEAYFGMPPSCNDGADKRVWPELGRRPCEWMTTPNFPEASVRLAGYGRMNNDDLAFQLLFSIDDRPED